MPVIPARYGAGVANPSPRQHAGSQNSRLDIPSYVSGYFDGEGCFSVSISPRPRLKVGWEVRPSVSISQNEDRRQVVDLIHSYFACGSVRRDLSDRTIKWECRSVPQIVDLILPHFERWPLISAKRADVELLQRICLLMVEGAHLEPEGLQVIARLAEAMNPSGIRRYSVRDIERTF